MHTHGLGGGNGGSEQLLRMHNQIGIFVVYAMQRNAAMFIATLGLRYDLTDIAHIAFMFNSGQSPASILSPILLPCRHF